jgi:hypothetical protein
VIRGSDCLYEPDIPFLETLLGIPLKLQANTQSGVPALALDVWLAYELRRAGFHADSVWPRASEPRILPAPIAALLASATPADRAIIENRLRISGQKSGSIASKARVLGKNYEKQVDVVLSAWNTGPEILISTKRMDSSFGKNAANRVEESYGDAKNLRLRHPLAALGFVFGLRSTIYDREAKKAAWLLDLLEKLGHEDDAYHGVALVLMEYEVAPPPGGEEINEPESGPSDDPDAYEPTEPVNTSEIDADLDELPRVNVLLKETPEALHPAVFLQTMIERVLATTPIDFHTEARAKRDGARISS